MPGTMVRGVPWLVYGTGRKVYKRVLEDAIFKMVPGRREPALPWIAWKPSGQTGSFSCTTYLILL